jgi:transposase
MLPVNNDTLLRVVTRRSYPRTDPLIVAGIDDWALRKNHRYGSIVCDLKRRWIVPDRETATVRAWLSDHPGISAAPALDLYDATAKASASGHETLTRSPQLNSSGSIF